MSKTYKAKQRMQRDMARLGGAAGQQELFAPSHTMYVHPDVRGIIAEARRHIDSAKMMIRYGALSPAQIRERLETLPDNASKYERWAFGNISAMATPKRLRSFQDNPKCVCCGREGNVYIVERHRNETTMQYLNLYSAGPGGLVLMTVDHIYPDSLGGRYAGENFQTMCRLCNQSKMNIMSLADIELVKADPAQYAKSWMDLELVISLCDLQAVMHSATEETYINTLNNTFEEVRRSIRHNMSNSAIKACKSNIFHTLKLNPAAVSVPQQTIWNRVTNFLQKLAIFPRVFAKLPVD